MIGLIVLFFFCLGASAFFSAAEMAYVSANRIKFREMADSGSRSAKAALSLLDRPQEFLTVNLIGNNIVNVAATAILTYLFELHGMANEWLITAFMAPLLIIVGETVPKDYARLRSQSTLEKVSAPLFFLLKILQMPVRWVLRGVDFFLGSLGTALDRSIFVSEKEFRLLIEESAKSGILAHHEKQLIDTIMDFERIKVMTVMTPLLKADKIDITQTIGHVKEMARCSGARMFLVSEELPDLVVGMIYVFDILFETNEKSGLKNYLRSPVFLHKNTSIEKAFLTLQEKRQSFAVVTDDDGEVMGTVAIEKLFSHTV